MLLYAKSGVPQASALLAILSLWHGEAIVWCMSWTIPAQTLIQSCWEVLLYTKMWPVLFTTEDLDGVGFTDNKDCEKLIGKECTVGGILNVHYRQ